MPTNFDLEKPMPLIAKILEFIKLTQPLITKNLPLITELWKGPFFSLGYGSVGDVAKHRN